MTIIVWWSPSWTPSWISWPIVNKKNGTGHFEILHILLNILTPKNRFWQINWAGRHIKLLMRFLLRFLIVDEVLDEVLDSQWGSYPRPHWDSDFGTISLRFWSEKQNFFRKGRHEIVSVTFAFTGVSFLGSADWHRIHSFQFVYSLVAPVSWTSSIILLIVFYINKRLETYTWIKKQCN